MINDVPSVVIYGAIIVNHGIVFVVDGVVIVIDGGVNIVTYYVSGYYEPRDINATENNFASDL